MARDDEQSSLSARVGAVKGRLGTLESIMNGMVKKIKRLSLKFNDRSLADDVYRSGY